MDGLPSATAAFTGREQNLEQVLLCLAPSDARATSTAVVAGMGGIGKTELAVQAAHAALDRGWFPGGALFVNMSGYSAHPLTPAEALDGFLSAVGIPNKHIPPAAQDKSRLLRSVLATYATQERRVLVVIDNAFTSEQAQPLLPAGRDCAIVTSRHALTDLNARLINLEALPLEHGVALLGGVLAQRDPDDTRVHDHPGDARRLARFCGGLPLALQILAAQLAAILQKPLAVLADDLADAATRLEELAFANQAVRAVFDSSYHRLPATHARLYRLLSLNPGPMSPKTQP